MWLPEAFEKVANCVQEGSGHQEAGPNGEHRVTGERFTGQWKCRTSSPDVGRPDESHEAPIGTSVAAQDSSILSTDDLACVMVG